MQSQNSYKWIFDLTKKDFSTLVASSMTSLEKKGWDPLRRATILSSWRKAKLDFGFDKMMNLSLSLIYSTWSIPSLICPTPLEPKNYHSNLTTWATHGDWFSSIASDSFMTLTVVN